MSLKLSENEIRRKCKIKTKNTGKSIFNPNSKVIMGILSSIGVVSIVVIIILIIYISNTAKNAEIRSLENAVIIDVVRGDVFKTIEGRGTIEAINSYEITSLVDGDVLEDYFEEGQFVEKGDLLYLISHTELDKNIKIAQNNLNKAKEIYNQTQMQISKLNITSKTQGSITKLYVKEGDVISEGSEIADVVDFENLILTIDFLKEDAQHISAGETAIVQLQGSSQKIMGEVTYKTSGALINEYGIPVTSLEISIKNPGGIKLDDRASALIGEYACNSIGTFSYANTFTIRSESQGVITQIHNKVGDYVSINSSIVTLYNSALEKELSANKISISDAQFTLDSYKEQLNDYKIISPISGKVVKKTVKVGEKLNAKMTTESMARIEDLSLLTFQINVDESDIKNVYKGQKVSVVPDAFDNKLYSGHVENISAVGTTEDNVTVYPVTIVLDGIDESEFLISGMNVTATMEIDSRKNVLIIPTYALNRGNIVTILNTNSNKKMTQEIKIETGLYGGEYVEIVNGLNEGDSVVVYGDN